MIIACAGQKGGSGKTTTAINIADELHRRGDKVLLVDADPQGSTLTWASVASEQAHSIPTVIAVRDGFHRPEQLPTLSKNYTHTVIDCPPRHGTVLRAALVCSDLAVLPCRPTPHDLHAMAETLDAVENIQVVKPLVAAILLTQRLPRTVIGREALSELRELGLYVFKAELGTRVAFQEAHAAGLGVTRYHPGSKAAREVQQLVDELLTLSPEDTHG